MLLLHERFAAVANVDAKPRILAAGIGLRAETGGIPHGTTTGNTNSASKAYSPQRYHLHCNNNAVVTHAAVRDFQRTKQKKQCPNRAGSREEL